MSEDAAGVAEAPVDMAGVTVAEGAAAGAETGTVLAAAGALVADALVAAPGFDFRHWLMKE